MSQDRYSYRELTLDEIIADPIVITLMRADNVEPEALEGLLRMAVSPFEQRSEARRSRKVAKTAVDPDVKHKLARPTPAFRNVPKRSLGGRKTRKACVQASSATAQNWPQASTTPIDGRLSNKFCAISSSSTHGFPRLH